MAEQISLNDKVGRIMSRPEFKGMAQFIFPTPNRIFSFLIKQQKVGRLNNLPATKAWNVEDIVEGLNRLSTLARDGVRVHYDYWSEADKAKDSRKKDSALLHFPSDTKGPFVLVVPGGGYFMVASFVEGHPVAAELNRMGYSAFVLHYRTGKKNKWPAPLCDLQQALHFILNHADEFNIDTENYAVVGFSAGGHLAASLGTQNNGYKKWNLPKPKALLLGYPMTRFENMSKTHKQSQDNILGKRPTQAQIDNITIVRNADEDYSPTYIMHCQDDDTVDFENGEKLANRLKELNVPCQLRAVSTGGHGIALGNGTSAQGWLAEAVQFWQSQE